MSAGAVGTRATAVAWTSAASSFVLTTTKPQGHRRPPVVVTDEVIIQQVRSYEHRSDRRSDIARRDAAGDMQCWPHAKARNFEPGSLLERQGIQVDARQQV
jgi:hypothetical protein